MMAEEVAQAPLPSVDPAHPFKRCACPDNRLYYQTYQGRAEYLPKPCIYGPNGDPHICHECGHDFHEHGKKYHLKTRWVKVCAACKRDVRKEAKETGSRVACVIVDRNQKRALRTGDRDSLFFNQQVVADFLGVDCGEAPKPPLDDFTCGRCGDLICLCHTPQEFGKCCWCSRILTPETHVRWYFRLTRTKSGARKWVSIPAGEAVFATKYDDLCRKCAKGWDG